MWHFSFTFQRLRPFLNNSHSLESPEIACRPVGPPSPSPQGQEVGQFKVAASSAGEEEMGRDGTLVFLPTLNLRTKDPQRKESRMWALVPA